MNSAWSLEALRLFIVIASAGLIGYVSNQWAITFAVHFIVYIAWLVYQIRTFELWLYRGANRNDAPDNSGVWQNMVQHLYRSQKSHKQRKKQLANMANYYHAVMRALPDATVVVNTEGEIEWANKASQKLLGIKPNKDVGQRIENILRNPEIIKLMDPSRKTHAIQLESPTTANTTLSVVRQQYDKGNSLIIAQDISQRVATQKLRKAFIANASHELRTPLTVISGYLEIMQDDEDMPPSTHGIVNNAYEQALRMDRILDNLLILSKLEEKRYTKSSGEVVNVKKLLERIVADFRVSYAETNHQFKLEALPVKLRVVENEFYSICQNLVSNAVKYSPPESEVSICWSINDAGYGCLQVTDNGDGIPVEHLSRLTERFYRVNQANRQVTGTGLGLSIVKHILDNFDGYLDIQSTVGKGSTFKACFPSYRLIDKK